MASASPTVRRRELGARLRALRTAAGMTVDDAAGRMEVSPAKISRLETGARGVSVADVRFLCDLYQVSTQERDRLLNLARESRRRSWWQEYGLPDSAQTFTGLEDAAVSMSVYETSFVPALLQTEDYASALTQGAALDTPADQVEQYVRARITRQERLRAGALEFWAVVDEAALLRPIGGPQVAAAQLEHVIERSREPRITVQILPLEAGAHPGMDSAFTILHLEEVTDVVYVEGLIGQFFLQSPNGLARYRRAFNELRAIALSPQESRRRIQSAADRLST
jgi:transcriptional regulator with XRE-family HTH domain